MSILPLIYGPNKIFSEVAAPVAHIDDSICSIINDMFETMYFEHAIGMGANMVGILKRIVVVDMQENNTRKPYAFINPEITWHSNDMQTNTEASICFPGISAKITRPKAIRMHYLDTDSKIQEFATDGFFAAVIQHEVDYLNGKIFLDYLSMMKRNMLLKKLQKHKTISRKR
jgi:peptide deformylase